jgi:hypothetical protein
LASTSPIAPSSSTSSRASTSGSPPLVSIFVTATPFQPSCSARRSPSGGTLLSLVPVARSRFRLHRLLHQLSPSAPHSRSLLQADPAGAPGATLPSSATSATHRAVAPRAAARVVPAATAVGPTSPMPGPGPSTCGLNHGVLQHHDLLLDSTRRPSSLHQDSGPASGEHLLLFPTALLALMLLLALLLLAGISPPSLPIFRQ